MSTNYAPQLFQERKKLSTADQATLVICLQNDGKRRHPTSAEVSVQLFLLHLCHCHHNELSPLVSPNNLTKLYKRLSHQTMQIRQSLIQQSIRNPYASKTTTDCAQMVDKILTEPVIATLLLLARNNPEAIARSFDPDLIKASLDKFLPGPVLDYFPELSQYLQATKTSAPAA